MSSIDRSSLSDLRGRFRFGRQNYIQISEQAVSIFRPTSAAANGRESFRERENSELTTTDFATRFCDLLSRLAPSLPPPPHPLARPLSRLIGEIRARMLFLKLLSESEIRVALRDGRDYKTRKRRRRRRRRDTVASRRHHNQGVLIGDPVYRASSPPREARSHGDRIDAPRAKS
jgi:hypothetical protein